MTLTDEGCCPEQAFLLEGRDGPVVVNVMQAKDAERSEVARRPPYSIDPEHSAPQNVRARGENRTHDVRITRAREVDFGECLRTNVQVRWGERIGAE
ncbi:MAG: hypothetical protein NVS3B21_26050 [Acidimicrobiales bacterium]